MRRIDYDINSNGCWIVTSHKPNNNGYAPIRIEGKIVLIHRYIYETANGPIPKDMIVRHKCDTRLCCNPDHLIIGSHVDNVMDRVERNRSAKGTHNGRAKLTEDNVREIRKSNLPLKELSTIYNVDPRAIRRIIDNKTWKHII